MAGDAGVGLDDEHAGTAAPRPGLRRPDRLYRPVPVDAGILGHPAGDREEQVVDALRAGRILGGGDEGDADVGHRRDQPQRIDQRVGGGVERVRRDAALDPGELQHEELGQQGIERLEVEVRSLEQGRELRTLRRDVRRGRIFEGDAQDVRGQARDGIGSGEPDGTFQDIEGHHAFPR